MENAAVVFSSTWWAVFLAGVSTLAIYSFLYRENRIYRLFEHFFIGIATAWGIIATIRYFLWPKVFSPLLGFNRLVYPDGSTNVPYQTSYLWFLLPIAFGSLYYFIYSKRLNWLAQLVIGFQFGFAGGLAFKGTFIELMPQVFDSFKPLVVFGAGGEFLAGESLTNIFFVFTLLTVLCYFFFTLKRKESGALEKSSSVGRWLMMGCFGAFFGSTIMARMALLVERLDFLINKWAPLFDITATIGGV